MIRFNVGIGLVGWFMLCLAPVMTLMIFGLTLVRLPPLASLLIALGAGLLSAGIAVLGFTLQRVFTIDASTITARGRSHAFAQVARIHVNHFRGTTGMSLTAADGRRIVVFALNTSVRPGLDASQWLALRGLIAGSDTTFIERGNVTRHAPRPEDTVPLAVVLPAIDAEIAALGAYGRTSSRGPFYRAIFG